MNWVKMAKIKKFTPIKEVFEEYGESKFQIGNCPVYYMGNGYLIATTPKRFKVENNERIEFGETGEYALSVYFFRRKEQLKAYFKMTDEELPIEEEILGCSSFEVMRGLAFETELEKVTSFFKEQKGNFYYQAGETRALREGKFVFQNQFVTWGNYTMFFGGKGKKIKASAVEFVLTE